MKQQFQTYKGYGISLNQGQYIARAYANPTFYGNNLSKIKRAINKYLKDDSFTDFNGTFEVK